MPSRALVFRIAAVALLLLAGMELIACEVSSSDGCEFAGAPAQSGVNCCDTCLCCCARVVLATPRAFEPAHEAIALDPVPSLPVLSYESVNIYHPPRA